MRLGTKVIAPYGPGTIQDIDSMRNYALVAYDADHILLPTWHPLDELTLAPTSETMDKKGKCECGAWAVDWASDKHSSWCPASHYIIVYEDKYE